MNEKPFRLDMGFNEALSRLAKVPKNPIKDKGIENLDDKKLGVKNQKNGATARPRHTAGKS